MDNFTFNKFVADCKTVTESTSYLEMFSYSDASLDSVEEHPLPPDEFDNFIHRRGIFAPAILPDDVHPVAGVRLLLQKNARHPETFSPRHISMEPKDYKAMIDGLHLPRLAIETTSVVGPYFWSGLHLDDDGNHYLHMVFRKSDVRKKGYTRGWELTLSHEFRTGITTGFAKGTPSSSLSDLVNHLKACSSELGHALLLPLLQFGYESSPAVDAKQRDARQWLRLLEHAIAMRDDDLLDGSDRYLGEGVVDFNAINRDLVECQSQVLWKRPTSYLSIISSLEETARLFMQMLPAERKTVAVDKFQVAMASRLGLYRKRWDGIEVYASTTMQRLEIQRSALYNLIAQKESKLSLQMAGEQRRLAHSSKHEVGATKGISLLGAVLLPGTFLASLFSTSFFDFHDATSITSTASPTFWFYWAVTIPLTLLVVALYFVWEKNREKRYAREDSDLEYGIDRMEQQIMQTMRKRNLTKAKTWDARVERKTRLAADEDNDYGAFKDPAGAATNSNTLAVPGE
ncbi:hypothetical protein B0T24DRAFT_113334 [Lasiosphaeria ovina]|uniref:Uncharacterized protein n=1 Tax=Lasiosphaeria ovina TaxID=92902 RepID=A0AAE0MYJ7_9PEZI|nr:hypothetical protein B0T24DRAFT_113334 [Lasiosphaeria ovina]